ncbi:hypothetical protein [Engelhardtia mirabilis]|uniref:Uncharacterized protein n=1 Tax=Engelhardtia mirabilis TaxID=2528011 RepID=A0A518BPY4_9BACT|nr:hypothetical protein Pla133_41470 [Planctomycetes bacterium Pla133]QDV03358.1 hypothetical protein Pla86_41460 [Planctomycetes bacterium Pla86]
MARRQANRSASRSTATRASSGPRRQTASAAQADADGGMGIEGAVAIVTTIVLIAACLMVDYYLGTTYGGGVFFKS